MPILYWQQGPCDFCYTKSEVQSMSITLHMVLMVLAVVCLFLAAINVVTPRGNLLAGGLCLWALATLITV